MLASSWPLFIASALLTRRAALTTVTSAAIFPPIAERAYAAEDSIATQTLGTNAEGGTKLTLGAIAEGSAALPQTDRLPIAFALRPEYIIESPDVLYPNWHLGAWRATSTLKSVFAPAGVEVFAPGRNGTEALRRAREETPLTYDVRWRRERSGDGIVVDREYNVASISRASMGASAVQNVAEDGPDHLTLVLRPAGAPASSLFQADLRVTARRTDPYPLTGRPDFFACAEVTRQTVTTIAGEKAAPSPTRGPLTKEIETICTYELDPANPSIMRGLQRTATFLVPDAAYTGDPSLAEIAASRLTRAQNGRLVAVDVRVYDLVYTRIV